MHRRRRRNNNSDSDSGQEGQTSNSEILNGFRRMNMDEMAQMMANMVQLQQRTMSFMEQQQAAAAMNQQRPPPPPDMALSFRKTWYERLFRVDPPKYEGEGDAVAAYNWVQRIEMVFNAMGVPEEERVRLAVSQLSGNAGYWWEAVKPMYESDGGQLSWSEFTAMFLNIYFPESVRMEKEIEFLQLKQEENMTVMEYSNRFHALGRFCLHIIQDKAFKAARFKEGLRPAIKHHLASHIHDDYQKVYERALNVEYTLNRLEQNSGDQRCYTTDRGQGSRQSSDERSAKNDGSRMPKSRHNVRKERCRHCNSYHSGRCFKRVRACFRCGKPGHKIARCPYRQTELERPNSAEQPQGNAEPVFPMT